MDIITAYLDNMFSAYPPSPRLSEAKAELRAMMEDAYQAALAAGHSENEAVGQVITEFGNLDELAPVLGIAADIRPTLPDGGSATSSAAVKYPSVTMAEAQGYSEAVRRTHPKLGIAVALFVISPSVLIAFQGLDLSISPNTAIFIGIAVLLLFVVLGIGIVLLNERELGQYQRITNGQFTPDPSVTAWAQGQRTRHDRKRVWALLVSVPLFVLSALPILWAALLHEGEQELLLGVAVPSTLLIVAIGLAILVPTTWAESVAQRLSVGSGTKKEDLDAQDYPRGVRVFFAIFWPLVLLAYLVWSFGWGAWHISWILWPIAGILSGIIGGVGNAVKDD
ncbi:hypothetical protein SAMN06298212_13526 [Ruaniaceae bacterium KH17]|nr:hypothetical protein SAMN06298212_13526 [Ruaniaceae bacterium KH17]